VTEEAAKTLANARKTKSYSCERCGAQFTGRLSRSDKNRPRFCSEQCRYATINERRKRERAEGRVEQSAKSASTPVEPPADVPKAPKSPRNWEDFDILEPTGPSRPDVLAAQARVAEDLRRGVHKPYDNGRKPAADLATPPQLQGGTP
jgi:endogenous inhibitor of DNA gyrase (YacG/DUF329 family)